MAETALSRFSTPSSHPVDDGEEIAMNGKEDESEGSDESVSATQPTLTRPSSSSDEKRDPERTRTKTASPSIHIDLETLPVSDKTVADDDDYPDGGRGWLIVFGVSCKCA